MLTKDEGGTSGYTLNYKSLTIPENPPEQFVSYTQYVVEAKMRLNTTSKEKASGVDENFFVLSQYDPSAGSGFSSGGISKDTYVVGGKPDETIENIDASNKISSYASTTWNGGPANPVNNNNLSSLSTHIVTAYDTKWNQIGSITVSADQELWCAWIVSMFPPTVFQGWLKPSQITFGKYVYFGTMPPPDEPDPTDLPGDGFYDNVDVSVPSNVVVHNLVVDINGDKDCYLAYDTPRSSSNAFIVKSAPPPLNMYKESYGVTSYKTGEVSLYGNASDLKKYNNANTGVVLMGNATVLNDNWHMLRIGVYLGTSFNTSGTTTSKNFVVLGATRFGCTSDGHIGNPVGTIPRIIDVEDGELDEALDAPENPYTSGLIGIGCGLFEGGGVDSYVLVDWVRVYQDLNYALQITMGSEKSTNYGWISDIPVYGTSTYDPNYNNALLHDAIYDDESAVFNVSELDSDTLYTLTFTVGNKQRNHSTMIELSDDIAFNNIMQTIGPIEDGAGNFTTIPVELTIPPGKTALCARFSTDTNKDYNKWAICALTVEKGRKSIQIGDSYD